jgi:hypothetical protein
MKSELTRSSLERIEGDRLVQWQQTGRGAPLTRSLHSLCLCQDWRRSLPAGATRTVSRRNAQNLSTLLPTCDRRCSRMPTAKQMRF